MAPNAAEARILDAAKRCFEQWGIAKTTIDDIAAKLWLDCHAAIGQLYLRGTFDKGVRPITIARMSGLAVALDEAHGTELIPVAYRQDHTWEEIEGWNQALNRVK